MKQRHVLAIVLLLTACGDGDGDGKRTTEPKRIVEPGSLYSGPVGGVDRYKFEDGSKLDFVVSGRMVVETPEGVALSSEFPANVTFSVRSSNGETLSGRAAFTDIPIDAQARFRADAAVKYGTAVISGAFASVSDATVLDVQGFSFPQAVSSGVKTHEIVLQGSRLTEVKLTPAP